MTIKEILREAFLRGHAWNPAYPNLQNVDMGRIQKMNGTERDAKDMMASRQAADINMWHLVAAFHAGRQPSIDGDIGPATRALLTIPRCSMPDHPPPPGAAFDYGDADLNGAVRSYQEFAEYSGGTGSWPKGCDPQAKDVHSVVVSMQTSAASSTQKEYLKEVLALVEKCEAEMGQSIRHVLDGSTSGAQHDVRFQVIAGGVIGFAYFPTPNTCNQTVTARLDNTFNPSALTFANLCVHEYKGHSDGLEHTRGGIMNPSIITINPLSWKGDPHEKTKTRYFGGVAIPTGPTSPPPTDPTDPTPDPWRGASVSVSLPGKPPRRFIPAIEV